MAHDSAQLPKPTNDHVFDNIIGDNLGGVKEPHISGYMVLLQLQVLIGRLPSESSGEVWFGYLLRSGQHQTLPKGPTEKTASGDRKARLSVAGAVAAGAYRLQPSHDAHVARDGAAEQRHGF